VNQSNATYLITGGTVLSPTSIIGEISDKLKEPDDFVYIGIKEQFLLIFTDTHLFITKVD
jgi:hypothetical protein